MPEASTSNPESEPQATSVTSVSGGVNLAAQRDVNIGGDVVGRDKITSIGYTVEQVSTLLTQISSTFQPKPFDGRCPYLGLDAFTEDDADRFFGRETLVSKLVARIKESRFVVIAGPSGSGKSSLVRAGLIHTLKQDALSASHSDRWLYATLTPGRDPVESLALAMSRMAKSPDAGDYIRGHKAEVDALHKFAESALSDRPDQRAIIFVDQFEEVFTQVSKEDDRVAFLNLLTHAATLENGRVTVLFALRSDFVSNCATYPQLNALLNQQFIQVGAMQPDELVNAIARPALQVGLRIDPDLVAQIVNDMQDEPGALPLMQFALKDLFDAQQAKGVIALTLNDYLARGGLRKALERHADAAFARLSESEQQLARTIFSRLIEIGRGTQDTRRTAAFDELVPANIEVAQVKVVMQKLADARLITTDERDHHVTVTIAHETLIDAWPWLRKLINENREAIYLQNQIAEDAQEWNEHEQDSSYFYSGARLATAREELAEQKITLSELAQRFIWTSINAYESARRRRRRVVQGVISGLVIVSLVFAGLSAWAVNSQQAAIAAQQISRSRELSTVAVSELDSDPERSILIGLEASSASHTFEVENALRRALLASRVITTLRGHEDRVVNAQFSPDGQLIVTASYDKTARVWDATTGKALGVMRGHDGVVFSAQFSPDAKLIVTTSMDRTARVWKVATSQELTVLRGHWDGVVSAQFSPDGTQIVTTSYDQTARVWEVATGKELMALHGHEAAVTSAQFSPNGKQIITASADGTARAWEVATGQELAVLHGHEARVNSAQFSPDGKQIVTAGCDKTNTRGNCTEGTVRMWSAVTGNELAVLHRSEGSFYRAQFSPDGKQIIAASADGTARVWEIATGQELAVLRGHEAWVNSAQFSPDGKQIVTAGCDKVDTLGFCIQGTARVWDAMTSKELAVLRGGHEGPFNGAQFSPDGRQIVTTSWDMTARVWEAGTGRELALLHGHEAAVTGAQFSSDGNQIVTASGDQTARIWETATGQELAVLRGHEDEVISAQFSPDGKQIVTASGDGTARLWEVATGQQLAVLHGHETSVVSAQFSPDGKQIVTASLDKTARVWDTTMGKEVTVLRGHEGSITNAQFSPDGKQIVTASLDKIARVWEAATGKELAALHGHESTFYSIHFSPDGKQIVAAGCDNADLFGTCLEPQKATAWVWEVATGKELALRGHTGRIYSTGFSPNGKQIVTASYDKTARIWDAITGQELAVLRGHDGSVYSAQFSPDGKHIVTASEDRAARIWDAVTGKELAVLQGHDGAVRSAQFSPNGKQVVTASADGTARVYVVYIEDLIALAKTRVIRELTCEERVQYLHEDIVCSTPTPQVTPTP